MATLADELLNDFEDDRDETNDQENGFHDEAGDQRDEVHASTDYHDGDEAEMEDADEEIAAAQDSNTLDTADDEEETKAKIEKMRLGGIRDVRNVAGLMKLLEPVLEVSVPLPSTKLLLVYTAWI
jgi:U4/U6 small nuclear ribonucleoprotein PRP31